MHIADRTTNDPQRDQNKIDIVNMDSGALGTMNQKVAHKANKNIQRLNGSVWTIGKKDRKHPTNPCIWKKEMFYGKIKDRAGGNRHETKWKKHIFHLAREWWPLKTQPIIIVNPINKVNIKRRGTGNRKRKLWGYFLPLKLHCSFFCILLFSSFYFSSLEETSKNNLQS